MKSPSPFQLSNRFSAFLPSAVLMVLAALCQGSPVVYIDSNGGLVAREVASATDPIGALNALAEPPQATGTQQPLLSAIPAGTRVAGLQTSGDTATVEFTPDVLGGGFDELKLETIYRQVKGTLAPFGLASDLKLETGGKPLNEYLPPAPVIAPEPAWRAEAQPDGPLMAGKLGGKIIGLSPGHGRFWTGSGWGTQRPVYCSPLLEEDYHNLEIMKYLETYLKEEGATIKAYRCFDKNYGNHSSGTPWWKMASPYWLQNQGYPCSVYASYTGDCTLGSGGSESNDDIRARPLASDRDGADIYVSLHSNGNAGDCTGTGCATGSETYYDAGTEHAAYGAVSQTLANNVNTAIMDALKTYADSTWTCHGTCVKNSNGNYGEIRIPDRAAILTELAFHDTCDRDADVNHLRDNFFRSTAMWGMYKGICTYFGVTPTWAFYSDELVSHDIPATMVAGSSTTVHITFRNRGVLWKDARNFRLGAVADSDPFTTTTRYTLGAEVGPGETKTFAITLRAPSTPGAYTTDWRMLREGATWFGATASATINVTSSDAPVVTTDPVSQAVNPGSTVTFNVIASGVSPFYQWRKDGVNLTNGGKFMGVRTDTLTITNVQQTETGNYSVMVTNSAGSDVSQAAMLTVNAVVLFQDTFESGGLGAWTTQSGAGALAISSAQQHTSGGGYSAYLDSSLDKMYVNLGAELVGHTRAVWWIYDSTQARAYGEVRSYAEGGYPGTLTQLLAAGKYSSVTMTGEVYDSTKYQGRVVTGSNNGWFNLNAAGAPSRGTGWHKFEIERLSDGTTVNFYVDGVLARQVTGVADVPWNSVAIGSVAAGTTAGDAWFDDVRMEYFDPPVIQADPLERIVGSGEPVSFAVSATGNALTYQWRKNGTNLTNQGMVAGATVAMLTLSSTEVSDSGTYDVVVRNGAGAVASMPAELTVLPPPPIIAGVQALAGNVVISWTAVSNTIYRVQYKTNLADTVWTDLPGDVTASGSTASKTDARTDSQRFYRILSLH